MINHTNEPEPPVLNHSDVQLYMTMDMDLKKAQIKIEISETKPIFCTNDPCTRARTLDLSCFNKTFYKRIFLHSCSAT
jgi:hypothetical protein